MSISDSLACTLHSPCHGLGREEHSEARGAGTCHRANGIEVMDWSVLPDAAVIILRAPDRVLAELHSAARS